MAADSSLGVIARIAWGTCFSGTSLIFDDDILFVIAIRKRNKPYLKYVIYQFTSEYIFVK